MTDARKEQLLSLYPHMRQENGGDRSTADNRAALKTSVLEKAARSAATQQAFFDAHSDELITMAHALATCFANDGRLLCMGNGGSSCDAAHLAVEFNHPVTPGRPALPSINLSADTAMITAVANDVGIEHIFLRQLLSHGKAGDALFAISTSGNSGNLVTALRRAREMGIATFALTGADGGEIAKHNLADHCLTVAVDSVHRIQETHVIAYHILWDLVHTVLHSKSVQQ